MTRCPRATEIVSHNPNWNQRAYLASIQSFLHLVVVQDLSNCFSYLFLLPHAPFHSAVHQLQLGKLQYLLSLSMTCIPSVSLILRHRCVKIRCVSTVSRHLCRTCMRKNLRLAVGESLYHVFLSTGTNSCMEENQDDFLAEEKN
jgi:hypothetical protein